MDFKKKLKLRLYTAIIYIVLGIAMIMGAIVIKTDNTFISSFGFALAVIGVARIRNYFIITKSEESIKKQMIAETDERNIAISNNAKSIAFTIYTILLCTGVILLSFFDMHDAVQWIAYSVCLLVLIYWIAYLIIRKKS